MFNDTIDKINSYLKEQPWMDFEMFNMNRGKLELCGFLDEADDDKVKIIFEQPYMVSCNFFFTYEGNNDFISVVDGEEAFKINKNYGITQGNTIFKIFNTDVTVDMFIAAKGIKLKILE